MELVSILVRTCNRPHILKETLESIRKQKYPCIEVIVVEDGENTAEQMLKEEFSDLNFKYKCTGERKGRTVAGNLALSMSSGRYLNFLDDDDLIFPNHIEQLAAALENSEKKAAYSVAYESVVKYDEKEKKYRECKRRVRFRQPFNRVFLTFNNYIPIQSILFERSLYEELGGFDEKLDLLEDWDLWVRYSTRTDFLFVDEITSLYRVPRKKRKRDTNLFFSYEKVVEKYADYERNMNYYEINQEVKYLLEEMKTPGWKKVMKKIRNKLIYRQDGENS